MDKTARNGVLFVLASSLGYASLPIFTKFIYRYSDLTEMDVAFWRFVIAVPLMWVATWLWLRITKPGRLNQRLPRVRLMLSGTLVVGAALAAFFGLRRLDAGVYVALFFTYPAMTVLINTLLGEPLPLRGWVALAMTTAGVVFIVVNPSSTATLQISLAGVLIGLFNALIVAVFVVVNERVQRGYPTTAMASAWSMSGTLLIVLPLTAVRGGVGMPPTPRVWLLVLGLGAIATVLAYFGLIMGNKLLGASRAAIIATVEPIMAIVLAWTLLGERLIAPQFAGAALIIVSLIVLEAPLPNRKAKAVASTATSTLTEGTPPTP